MDGKKQTEEPETPELLVGFTNLEAIGISMKYGGGALTFYNLLEGNSHTSIAVSFGVYLAGSLIEQVGHYYSRKQVYGLLNKGRSNEGDLEKILDEKK